MAMEEKRIEIDPFSFHLGMINCFVEMVACGVKQLAISPPLSPSHYEEIAAYSQQIVDGFGVASFLEKSLLVTMLQSPGFTQGKYSILYYKHQNTLDTYLGLKERQVQMIAQNRYDKRAQKDISTAFMTLLSYPPEVIASKLSGQHADPFIILETAGT